jgi:MFS family permease
MTSVSSVASPFTPEVSRASSWIWVHVAVAALAMVLTLPGRTHGLGLFTEPLLKSLSLDRESYGFMNLWATLLGALFCLPCGWLLDRLGTRVVYIGVTVSLGLTVIAMSLWTEGAGAFPLALDLSAWGGTTIQVVILGDLFLFLLLTRGLGQSALSVVSLGLIGRSTGPRSGLRMGVYAFVTTAGFLVAFTILGEVVKANPNEWRPAWAGIGLAVLVLGLLGGTLVRKRFLEADPSGGRENAVTEASFTVSQALRHPAFWTFSVATSFYGLVAAGTSLFNESILAERGFDKSIFVNVTKIGIPIGLAANLFVGWLATRWPLNRMMALATGLLAAALATFPTVTTEAEVYAYACALAAAGGGITVCFFSIYRRAFGPGHLGSIQGIAQMLTVLFSAAGPLIFASTKTRFGAYSEVFPIFAGIAAVLAVFVLLSGLPKRPTTMLEQ